MTQTNNIKDDSAIDLQPRLPRVDPESKKLNLVPRKPRYILEKDVILPPESDIQIKEALIKIKYHKKIYQEWGFDEADPKGKGVILNFYGMPGTGKTLTAEALAGTLGLSFLAVGIAELESKFMGDTAKNIQRVFAIAEDHNALLFFDEADTLLGKRLSSVTQGVDNEVNASRTTMLIEIERFEGVLVFASNFTENYDKAFESRISHHVHFKLPDIHGRRAIWQKHFVKKIPTLETRDELIEKAAESSDGFAGRDIRTCLRLALPKPLLESELSGEDPLLNWRHIEESILQVRKAYKEVGKEVQTMSQSDRDGIRKMLGASDHQTKTQGE
jgi:SpoVK/Ycf46/Vps4 family AAA+-type ATPase